MPKRPAEFFGQLPRFADALSVLGACDQPLPYGPTVGLQLSISFINLAIPSTAARVALSVRYFQKQGVAAATVFAAEPVIDFEVTPNRPDWLGVEGIARDLAATGIGRFKHAPVEPVAGAFPCPIEIRISSPEACPAFAGRLIRGVKNGPSPAWLQVRVLQWYFGLLFG